MSRFLDERGRIFGKVNIVDILVLLVIVAIVIFAVTRLTGGAANTIPLRVTFKAEGLRNDEAAKLEASWQPGITITDENGTVLGKAQAVGLRATSEEYLTPDGQLKEFQSPIFSDVFLEVLGKGQASGNSARIGSVSVLDGDKVVVVGARAKKQMFVDEVAVGAEAVK